MMSGKAISAVLVTALKLYYYFNSAYHPAHMTIPVEVAVFPERESELVGWRCYVRMGPYSLAGPLRLLVPVTMGVEDYYCCAVVN